MKATEQYFFCAAVYYDIQLESDINFLSLCIKSKSDHSNLAARQIFPLILGHAQL